MNEKEKEAIEKINKITEDCEYICMQRNEDTELYSDKPVPYIENRILLNLIEKQDKIINEMADEMADIDYDYMCGNWCGNETGCDGEERATCIKKYFTKKVGE